MKFEEWLPVFGDVTYRGPCNLEDTEQIDFFAHLRLKWPQYHEIAIHPKNEGRRTPQQVQKEKKMGLKKGASDIVIPGCPTLVIELKRMDHVNHSSWEKGQREYLQAAQNNGSFVCVALGYKAALEAVEYWHKNRV